MDEIKEYLRRRGHEGWSVCRDDGPTSDGLDQSRHQRALALHSQRRRRRKKKKKKKKKKRRRVIN